MILPEASASTEPMGMPPSDRPSRASAMASLRRSFSSIVELLASSYWPLAKPNSFLNQRSSAQICGKIILLLLIRPPARNHPGLRVEMHAVFSQCVQIAEERVSPSGKREEGHRSGHAHVDPHHSGGDVLSKLARRAA